MAVTALGMIETVGLVSAIEAADAGLKAAQVRLLGSDYVRGGLVMVRFEGEVAAVKAAVDAGAQAAGRVGKVFSAHVIPRALPEVFCMLASDISQGPGKLQSGGCVSCGGCEGGRRETAALKRSTEHERSTESVEPEHPAHGKLDIETCKSMKVLELRKLARKLPGFPLTANDIRYANKSALLDALSVWLTGKQA